MSKRTIIGIEVGVHEGKVGFVMHFDDRQDEAFLLDLPIAKDFFARGTQMALTLERQLSADNGPRSQVSVGDAVKLRLL